jgi:hypothetical protein
MLNFQLRNEATKGMASMKNQSRGDEMTKRKEKEATHEEFIRTKRQEEEKQTESQKGERKTYSNKPGSFPAI